jgi:hypothetical protein
MLASSYVSQTSGYEAFQEHKPKYSTLSQTGLKQQPDGSFMNAYDIMLASSDVSQTSGYEAFQEHKPN